MVELNPEAFVAAIDRAELAHYGWTQKILRCAVLKHRPEDPELGEDGDAVCDFGRWFARERGVFDQFDTQRSAQLAADHRDMHRAIARICAHVEAGKAGTEADLDAFERSQRGVIEQLAFFKTLALRRFAQIDALTGLPTRFQMEQDFARMQRSAPHGAALVLMFVDVDHFKRVNDECGHAVGDQVLRAIAAALRHALRSDDNLYRFGGEEFVVLSQVSDPAAAPGSLAEHVMRAVRGLEVAVDGHAPVRMTVTIGVATHVEGDSLTALLQRADEAMYRGKQAGRDRVVLASPPGAARDG